MKFTRTAVAILTIGLAILTPDLVFAGEPKQKPTKKARQKLTPPPTGAPLTPANAATLPDGLEQLDLFLLMGQSNMKGRGVMPEKAIRNPRIINLHLKTDSWFLARHPLHLTGSPDTFKGHDNAGVGPGLTFAENISKHYPKSRIGLIPCAIGGSRIAYWKKGAPMYESAVRRAKLAIKSGPDGKTTIKGAIWLQGEADSKEDRLAAYPAKLARMIKDLRTDLDIDDLPFIACTIGEMRGESTLQKKINLVLLDLPNQVNHTGCVDARELKTHIGDQVHFDTAAQEEMGRRFAREYLQLKSKGN